MHQSLGNTEKDMGLDKEKMPESSPTGKTYNFCFTCRKLGDTSAIRSPFPASTPWKTARSSRISPRVQPQTHRLPTSSCTSGSASTQSQKPMMSVRPETSVVSSALYAPTLPERRFSPVPAEHRWNRPHDSDLQITAARPGR